MAAPNAAHPNTGYKTLRLADQSVDRRGVMSQRDRTSQSNPAKAAANPSAHSCELGIVAAHARAGQLPALT